MNRNDVQAAIEYVRESGYDHGAVEVAIMLQDDPSEILAMLAEELPPADGSGSA